SDFAAFRQPLCATGATPDSGMTTDPDLPFAALWMCDESAVPIFDQVRLKQTCPLLGISWYLKVPVPIGLPFGTSWPPVMWTVNVFGVLLGAPSDDPAATRAPAARANDVSMILRILSPVSWGLPRAAPWQLGDLLPSGIHGGLTVGQG